MSNLSVSVRIRLIYLYILCVISLAACTPASAPPTKAESLRAAAKTESSPKRDFKISSTVNANLNGQGEVSANISGIAVLIKAAGCTERSPGIALCNRSVIVEVTFPGGNPIKVEPEAIYLDSNATLYHGPLDNSYKKNGHSIILTDINGDGHEDLVVWSGKEGNYGGSSYSVYLFDAAQQRLVFNQSLSDITVMANGLFSVKGKILKSTSGDGCCFHVFDTYELNKDEAVLVERVTEDANNPADTKKKTERLQNGEMKEVVN